MTDSQQDHCAKFSDALLPVARHMLSCIAGLPTDSWILDPMAGTGKGPEYLTEVCGFMGVGIELEPEWVECSDLVWQGNALDLPSPRYLYGQDDPEQWDAIFTSPTYGNRMADKDQRPSVAGTYAKSLGRLASEGSSNHLQWGESYRNFHVGAWLEATRVLHPHGWFLLNIKNHIRDGEEQFVSEWHAGVLGGMGYTLVDKAFVETPGNRRGANSQARVAGENLYLFQKGA